MPKAKSKNLKTKAKKTTKISELKVTTSNILPGGRLNNFLNNFPEKVSSFRKSKTFYLVLLAIGLTLLIMFKRSWFIAALVNGAPISNFELQSKLNQQFRNQILTQLVNEKIILSEAQKNNAVPTDAEIDKKIAELESSVGGKETLESLLAQQGQTVTTLRDQVKVQLAITKLYENEATVSSQEVAKYLEENKDQMRATESAEMEKEAYEAIRNQKLTQIFSEKFQQLRSKAKIQIF